MKNVIVTLTTPSDSPSAPAHHRLSTHTKVWRCFQASTPASGFAKPLPPDAHPHPLKRQKVEPQVHVRQTEVIQPSESVTVTCAFAAPEVGACGEVEYCVHLHFSIQGSTGYRPSGESQGGAALLDDESLRAVGQGEGEGGDLTGDGRDVGPRGLQGGERTKCVSCGAVVVTASAILQQREQLSRLMEAQGKSPATPTGKDVLFSGGRP